MEKVFKFIAAGLAVAAFCIAAAGCGSAPTTAELYNNAVYDAMIADEDEIFPLVCLTEEDERARFDEGGRTLLVSWHSYPESYPEGQTVTLQWGEVWTFTLGEIADWSGDNADSVTDWTLRLEQLIGLPENDGKTHFTAFWVDLEDVVRPAYRTDPTADEMDNEFPDGYAQNDPDEIAFKEWFDDNIIGSYYDSEYPWTRLGYTYDWSGDDDEYGLTEFLILSGTETEVAFTETTEEFLQRLEKECSE